MDRKLSECALLLPQQTATCYFNSALNGLLTSPQMLHIMEGSLSTFVEIARNNPHLKELITSTDFCHSKSIEEGDEDIGDPDDPSSPRFVAAKITLMKLIYNVFCAFDVLRKKAVTPISEPDNPPTKWHVDKDDVSANVAKWLMYTTKLPRSRVRTQTGYPLKALKGLLHSLYGRKYKSKVLFFTDEIVQSLKNLVDSKLAPWDVAVYVPSSHMYTRYARYLMESKSLRQISYILDGDNMKSSKEFPLDKRGTWLSPTFHDELRAKVEELTHKEPAIVEANKHLMGIMRHYKVDKHMMVPWIYDTYDLEILLDTLEDDYVSSRFLPKMLGEINSTVSPHLLKTEQKPSLVESVKEALIGSLRKQQGLKTTGVANRTIPANDTPLYRLDHVSIIYLPDGSPHPHVVIGSFCNDQPYILDSDMPNGTGFYPSAWNGAKLEDAEILLPDGSTSTLSGMKDYCILYAVYIRKDIPKFDLVGTWQSDQLPPVCNVFA